MTIGMYILLLSLHDVLSTVHFLQYTTLNTAYEALVMNMTGNMVTGAGVSKQAYI